MNAQRRKSWMWAEACALVDQAERRQRSFFELLAVPAAVPVWEPPVNVFAVDGELHVVVALPGAGADDVLVQITESGLVIEAAVSTPFAVSARVLRMEIPHGRMRRRIDLPAGRYVLLENRLERGYLMLRLTGSNL